MSDDNQTRNISYQVDTVSNVNYTVLGYADTTKNMLHLRHNTENEFVNSAANSPAVIQHEQKHLDNSAKGMYDYGLSREQAYKICMWDEISANMAALIALRDKYIKTGDITLFDAEGEKFSFYKEAIKKGEINPKSQYKEDFDKEMKLIVNGTKNMWCEQYAGVYDERNYKSAILKYDWSGSKKEHYDENYLRARSIACNIGGIDFTKYLDKDIEIPKTLKEKLAAYKEERTFRDIGNDLPILEKGKQQLKYIRDSMYSFVGISVNNDPIRTPQNSKPVADSWSPELRVSPIQHRKILDMNKNVIKKPTKLREAGKDNLKPEKVAKMVTEKIVAQLKEDKKKANNIMNNITTRLTEKRNKITNFITARWGKKKKDNSK